MEAVGEAAAPSSKIAESERQSWPRFMSSPFMMRVPFFLLFGSNKETLK